MSDDLRELAEAAKAATAAYIADPTDRDTGRQWDRACAEFSLACTEDAILALYAERDEARADFEQAADWNKIVDEADLDRFDEIADQWLAMDAIQRLHNAVTSVFAKWSNDQIMTRFKEHMTNVMHQSFVEGAICGVRASKARAEAALAAMGERGAASHPLDTSAVVSHETANVSDKPVAWRSKSWPGQIGYDVTDAGQVASDWERQGRTVQPLYVSPEAEIARLTEARRKDAEAFESLRNANNIVRDRAKNAEALVERYKIALADAIRRPMGVTPDSAVGLVTTAELDAAEARRPKHAALSPAVEAESKVEPRF